MNNKYPYQSTPGALNTAVWRGNKYINDHLNPIERKQLNQIKMDFGAGNNSLIANTIGNRIKPSRQRYYDKVITKQFNNKDTICKNSRPDLYMLGGLPASGKSTALVKEIPEKTIIIDSDYYKQQLAKKTKSPMRRFFLAHAQLLHDESDTLIEEAIQKSIKEKRDVTFDGTFKTYNKGVNLINRFRNAGYKIHYLATQKSPSRTIVHAAKRFIKRGRYVPLEYIKKNGNLISANSWRARELADDYEIFDTNNKRPRLIIKSKRPVKRNPFLRSLKF